jgi:hypothetical protein
MRFNAIVATDYMQFGDIAESEKGLPPLPGLFTLRSVTPGLTPRGYR